MTGSSQFHNQLGLNQLLQTNPHAMMGLRGQLGREVPFEAAININSLLQDIYRLSLENAKLKGEIERLTVAYTDFDYELSG